MSMARYILFPVGGKRYALPAGMIAELALEGETQVFPHHTALLRGVQLRRGRLMAVCDIRPMVGEGLSPENGRRLIVRCRIADQQELMALMVGGECEIREAEATPPSKGLPEYVTSLLVLAGETIEVLDLEKMLQIAQNGLPAGSRR